MAHAPDIFRDCNACGNSVKLSDFVKDNRSKNGYGSWCKFCKNKKNMQWAKSNPEKISKISKKWRLANPKKIAELKTAWREANREQELAKKREWSQANKDKGRLYSSVRRAKKRSTSIFKVTSDDIQKLKALNCAYCQAPSEQIDHVIPLARGGSHSIGNLAPACKKCNQSKGSKLLIEWKLKDKV